MNDESDMRFSEKCQNGKILLKVGNGVFPTPFPSISRQQQLGTGQ